MFNLVLITCQGLVIDLEALADLLLSLAELRCLLNLGLALVVCDLNLLLLLWPVSERNWVLLAKHPLCSLCGLLLQLVELHLDEHRALRNVKRERR